MKFVFKDPFASEVAVTYSSSNTHTDAASVFVSQYFSQLKPQICLANSIVVIQDATDHILNDKSFIECREELMQAPVFAVELTAAIAKFCTIISRHLAARDASADVWWEFIENDLMPRHNVSGIARELFIADEPIVVNNQIKIINADQSVVFVDRHQFFDECIADIQKTSFEAMLTAFADSYIRNNADALSSVFANFVQQQLVRDDYAEFLKNIRRCAADAMFNAIAELEESCDPVDNFLQELVE